MLVGAATAVVLVVLSVVSSVVAARPAPQPAAPRHAEALPRTIYSWSGTFPRAVRGTGGPLAAVLTPSVYDQSRSDGDAVGQLVGVSATDGSYHDLDLPDTRLGTQVERAPEFGSVFSLSPDGHYLAYYYGGTPSHSVPAEYLPAAMGVAVYDTADGAITRHPISSEQGLAPQRLLWTDDTLWIDASRLRQPSTGSYGSTIGPWFTVDGDDPAMHRVRFTGTSGEGPVTSDGTRLTLTDNDGYVLPAGAERSHLGATEVALRDASDTRAAGLTVIHATGTVFGVSVSPDDDHLVLVSGGRYSGFTSADGGLPEIQHLELSSADVGGGVSGVLHRRLGPAAVTQGADDPKRTGAGGPPLAWVDDTHVVVTVNQGRRARIESVDVTSGAARPLVDVTDAYDTVQIATGLVERPTTRDARPHYPPSVPDPIGWLAGQASRVVGGRTASVLLLGLGVAGVVLLGLFLPRRRRVA